MNVDFDKEYLAKFKKFWDKSYNDPYGWYNDKSCDALAWDFAEKGLINRPSFSQFEYTELGAYILRNRDIYCAETISDVIYAVQEREGVSFGFVMRRVFDYYSITSNESELDIINIVVEMWERNELSKPF